MKVVRWGNILAFAALVATFGAIDSPARAAQFRSPKQALWPSA